MVYQHLKNFIVGVKYAIFDIETDRIVGKFIVNDRYDNYVSVKGDLKGTYKTLRDNEGYECLLVANWNIFIPRSYDLYEITSNKYLGFEFRNNEIKNINLIRK